MKNRIKYLHYGQQQIEQDDIEAVINVLSSQFLTTGPEVEKFEKKLRNFIGSKYALVCSNGSTALMLAFLGLGINKKSTVIMPSNNFAASANAAINLGAKVIFCDSSPESGLVEPDHLENVLLKRKIKNGFFVGVHMNGQCMNMYEINKICRRYSIKIIDDAAHALGTKFKYRNKKLMIGSVFSEATTFSFHPVKTITMGEGGAITTNNKKIYENMKLFRNNGIERNSKNFLKDEKKKKIVDPSYYEIHKFGYNFRASDINCSLGSSQLSKINKFLSIRNKLVKEYDKMLKPLSNFLIPIKKYTHSETSFHLYVVLIDFSKINIDRTKLMTILKKYQIGTMVHYIPLHLQPAYCNLIKKSLHNSEEYYNKCLSLPLHANMNKSDVTYIVERMTMIFERFKI